MNDWDDLKYILAVSRNGGLSGAARVLGVNHSTVSRRIAAAEEHYGVRLFNRLPSGLVITEEGREAVEAAMLVEKSVADLNLQIASRDRNLTGEIRVTAPDVIIQVHLAGVFKAFARKYPEIDLTVISSNETLNLHQREADVAIRVSDSPGESLYGKRLVGQRRAFYASSRYVEEVRSVLDGSSKDTILDYIHFVWWGEKIPEAFARQYPDARIIARFNDMTALYGAVRAGMGISLLPCVIGESDASLQRISSCNFQPYRDVWVLTHPDLKQVERVRLFMKFTGTAVKGDGAVYWGE